MAGPGKVILSLINAIPQYILRPSSAFTGTYCYHRYCTGMPRKHEFYICSKAHLVACSLDASLVLGRRCFNTSSVLTDIFRNTEFDDTEAPVKMQDEEWDRFNTVVYPPMEEGQPVRPAEVCHSRFQIKYSPKKMWFIAFMVRGMSIKEAITQLSFQKRKGAHVVKEVLEEVQEIAVRDYNVEFKENLWICDSFVQPGITVKGLRKHAGRRYGIVHYRYVNYYVRLCEGKPPKHYYAPPATGHDKIKDYMLQLRSRRIRNSI